MTWNVKTYNTLELLSYYVFTPPPPKGGRSDVTTPHRGGADRPPTHSYEQLYS